MFESLLGGNSDDEKDMSGDMTDDDLAEVVNEHETAKPAEDDEFDEEGNPKPLDFDQAA